jgi:hypothetical protein
MACYVNEPCPLHTLNREWEEYNVIRDVIGHDNKRLVAYKLVHNLPEKKWRDKKKCDMGGGGPKIPILRKICFENVLKMF